MSSGLASDEVSEDYKNSLEDLTTNDRFQISNLTVIAKENTEHAMAISRVLENHIRTTPPSQKLPALYVVDSIVKNVGTPYTLLLGRNLYQTFMNAYTLVDSGTRRKLDEMLRTWKEPVPGSLDTRPVFPVEITRSIENALIKARTAALHQQSRNQQEFASRNRMATGTPNGQWRHTPVPASLPPFPINGSLPPQPPDTVDLAGLHHDIDNLISRARADFAASPFDSSCQQRLKALLDLQNIIQQQQLPQNQLKLIRDQVSQLSANHPPPRVSTPVQIIPQPTPPPQPQPNLQALLNPNTLASLLKVTTNQRNATPPPPSAPQPHSVPTSVNGTLPATFSENPLIASLRARGLLPALPTNPTPLAPSLPLIFPGQIAPTPTPISLPVAPSMNVPLTSSSIKIPRPNLISTLYEDQPNRCGTCGRRFPTGDEGTERKARHLDWHFKTNQRMVEATKRGQSRSWYLDERGWISSREYDNDSVPADEPSGATIGRVDMAAGAQKTQKQQYVHVPNDLVLRNAPCPICQEKFESTWSEEAQDWIWQDAVQVGHRIYHASCYEEVAKDGHGCTSRAPSVRRSDTPDSVLGKRKAEDVTGGTSIRIKTEPLPY